MKGEPCGAFNSMVALVLVAILVLMPSAFFLPCVATPPLDSGPTGPDRSLGPSLGPSLSIEIFPTVVSADVSEDTAELVIFQGTVTVDMPRMVNGIVTLQPYLQDVSFSTSVNPNTMEFTGPGSDTFTLIVIVPAGARAYAPVNIIVTGSLNLPAMSPVVASASVQLTVDEYFSAQATSREPTVTIGRGETGDIELVFNYTGNSDVDITMEVGGAHEGIEFEFPEAPFETGPGGSTNVTVRASVGSGAPSGATAVTIHFLATSHLGEATSLVAPFQVTVNVPTMAQRLGLAGFTMVTILLAAVGVVMYVGWRKGKLPKFNEIKARFLKKKATN